VRAFHAYAERRLFCILELIGETDWAETKLEYYMNII
jgi:hypothetical protein